MSRLYHLGLTKDDIKGATVALMPGDPARAVKIAREISASSGAPSHELASKREFTTFITSSDGKTPFIVTSTGIGGPSVSIAVEELARIGIRTFIRVGTTGAIQDYVKNGDCVITTGAVRLDGASRHYAPLAYPAVASLRVTNALVAGARAAGVTFHTGITASSDTFYQGEEKAEAFREYTIRDVKGSTEEWRMLHVLNYEMESATLFTAASSMGLEAGCITGAINRSDGGEISADDLERGENNVIKAAVAALPFLHEPS
ncbi:MAG: uridine phosphorylase [Thermodesulfobacteriota bacterium]